jgi:hypothetical protein
MKAKHSLPCSQELATGPHLEPDESSLKSHTVFFNIISPFVSSYLQVLLLRILHPYLARATSSDLLILGEYITLIILGEEKKLLSSLLRNFLHTPVIFLPL